MKWRHIIKCVHVVWKVECLQDEDEWRVGLCHGLNCWPGEIRALWWEAHPAPTCRHGCAHHFHTAPGTCPLHQFTNSEFAKFAPRPRHVLKIEDLIVYCIFSVKFELCNLLRWPQDGILWRFSITHQQTRTTCSLYEKSWYESLKKTDIGRIIADFSTWIHLVNTFQPRTGLKVWLQNWLGLASCGHQRSHTNLACFEWPNGRLLIVNQWPPINAAVS